ncbi:hypothetical protein EAF04_009267 [Stromatinia cepivora]|nr:hypothetical protein EAF04_009267 [Stromatinia cepivora]
MARRGYHHSYVYYVLGSESGGGLRSPRISLVKLIYLSKALTYMTVQMIFGPSCRDCNIEVSVKVGVSSWSNAPDSIQQPTLTISTLEPRYSMPHKY